MIVSVAKPPKKLPRFAGGRARGLVRIKKNILDRFILLNKPKSSYFVNPSVRDAPNWHISAFEKRFRQTDRS